MSCTLMFENIQFFLMFLFFFFNVTATTEIYTLSLPDALPISIAANLIKASGKALSPQHNPPLMGEQRRSSIDYGKFNKDHGWQPVQPLDEGLKNTFDFFAQPSQVQANLD